MKIKAFTNIITFTLVTFVLSATVLAQAQFTRNQFAIGGDWNPASVTGSLVYGKYGCTASKYVNGEYQYLPKGSFVLSKSGKYTYNGFAKPSSGTFTTSASGVISFKGGYLNNGKATPMEGRTNRFYLVSPTIPDGRWTCGLI